MMTSTSKPTAARNEKDNARSAQGTSSTAAPATSASGGVDRDERIRRIAEAAYYRAERRDFCPGCELEDWLAAERAIDDQLRLAGGGGTTAGGADEG